MRNWNLLKTLPVYILVAAVVSACGSSTTAFQNSSGGHSTTGGTTGPSSFPFPIISQSPSPTQSTTATPALSFVIGNTGVVTGKTGVCQDCLTGAGGNYPVYSTAKSSGSYINTDNVLQVQVTIQPSGQLSPLGTAAQNTVYGFDGTYNCASFQVSVYDSSGDLLGSQQTNMLAVQGSQGCITNPGTGQNGIVQASQSTQVLNFSGNISQGPHGPLDIRVQTLNYDFYCRLLANYWGSLYNAQVYAASYYDLWCPYKTVFKTHTVSADLGIAINGTTSLE